MVAKTSTYSLLSLVYICQFLVVARLLGYPPRSPLSLPPLQILATEVEELQRGHATTTARIAQYRRKLLDLSHRVLKVRRACSLGQWPESFKKAYSKSTVLER